MIGGSISGGWGFVWAVYGISWGVLLGYGLSLLLRSRTTALAALADAPQEGGGS